MMDVIKCRVIDSSFQKKLTVSLVKGELLSYTMSSSTEFRMSVKHTRRWGHKTTSTAKG